MVVTGMPIKIVGVAALKVLLFSEVMCACTYDALTQEIEEIFLFSEVNLNCSPILLYMSRSPNKRKQTMVPKQ